MADDLIEEFEDWLCEQPLGHGINYVSHARTFLRWHAESSLATLDEHAIRSFLLDWCPRRLRLPADESWSVCETVVELLHFLGGTGRLPGGPERARALMRTTNGLAGKMTSKMADPSNYGMAKSLLVDIEGSESMSDQELLAAMQRRIDEHTAPDLAEVDLAELMDAMATQPPERHSAMLAVWKPALPPSERAGLVAAMITAAEDARMRLVGLRFLGMFDAAVAEPHMRQLLDTAAAGHAAVWLLDHGLADGDAVGGFITPAIIVDILAQLIDHPDVLCEQFLRGHDPAGMLEFFWHHCAPETAAVLEALGQHLPDRALAKQARKAAIKHQTWMANRGLS
ncbi:hypothetical protein [Mycobacterium sp. RTGN5]|uniref:hypothetical protein n=1 Tax=Mycobacterium sp. RTGN5 TaxID=3016522 RepID=UPI0029C8B4E7|nr:hypothetical protein [Mycobacterium sp. RTGN5]